MVLVVLVVLVVFVVPVVRVILVVLVDYRLLFSKKKALPFFLPQK